jgi:hypothetical protein
MSSVYRAKNLMEAEAIPRRSRSLDDIMCKKTKGEKQPYYK